MNRWVGLVLAAILAMAVGWAIWARRPAATPALGPGATTSPGVRTVRGVVGSEKVGFFRDPAVVAAFRKQGLDVQVTAAGSRDIAVLPDLDSYDFALPSSVPAADRLRFTPSGLRLPPH